MGDYIIHNGELYHWGVKGMKWGIRRYQNKDGSLTELGRKHLAENRIRTEDNLVEKIIPKGTKMYRATPYEKDGQPSGPTYVTYLDVDRDMYKSGTIVNTYTDKQIGDNSVYEHEFQLKTDIRIPSLKTTREVEQKIVSNNKSRLVEIGKAVVESGMMTDMGYTKKDMLAMSNIADELAKTTSENKRTAIRERLVKKYGNEIGDFYYEGARYIHDGMRFINTIDYTTIENSLGRAHNVRSDIIKELKKMGYNAMYDNASIGVRSDGNYSKRQEGVEPLIIFDPDSTLSKNNTRKVSDNERRESNDRYEQWIKDRNKVLKKYKNYL